jgi:hypothetical protein
MNQQISLDEWDRHAEELAAHPDLMSIGVGSDAQRTTGLDGPELCRLVGDRLHDLTDGGADLLTLTDPHGRRFRLYARRRGRTVDVGTRRDWTDLGWEKLCDVLDARHETD